MGISKARTVAVNVIIGILCLTLTGVLFWAQLGNSDAAGSATAYNVTVDAVRGEILDRNGSAIVTNRQGNSITFNAVSFPSSDEQSSRNEIILSLIQLAEANNVEYVDNLPIILDSTGNYVFTTEDTDTAAAMDESDTKEAESYITWLKSSDMLNLNSYATAENCMDALIKRYQLESYSKQDARDIASVCVQMKKENFSKSYPYTFAEDVSMDFVTIIMENKSFYKGVENTVVAYREYTDGTLAPHVIGRTSNIDADTYNAKTEELEQAIKEANTSDEEAELKRNAYTVTDVYGSSGIELAMESYLRGTRGVKTVSVGADGTATETYSIEPQQGNAVVLTLDAGLQKVAQESLKNRVDTLNISSSLTCAAAVVVMNVNTGEVLACASYPTYDNSTWSENYSTWANDDSAPLWNRALNSVYEPGSTFKPLVAVAGLEEGVIDEDFTVACNGSYTYYSDHTYHCAHNKAHGTNNVVGALKESCNVFFYETGRLLGITKLDQWAEAFGLGQKTGIEISEATGQMSSPEERQASGGTWYPGDTITTAIGQCDNQFTLIQLCNYVATLANGGTRYVPHLVKKVLSADYSETVLEKDPEVAQKISISSKTLSLVKEGMLKVASEGSCKQYFQNLPVQVAAKTGTSEVTKKVGDEYIEGNNGFLISFAPYKDPEIAVAVVVETADAGSLTAVIAADIYDYYFSAKTLQSTADYNTLLS